MSEPKSIGSGMPDALRAAIAGDLRPVRPLPSPARRALWLVPLAALLLIAAPSTFHVRDDYSRVGFLLGWGASALQAAIGLTLAWAGLRESVPGRGWSTRAAASWLIGPVILVSALALVTWNASHTILRGSFVFVATLCAIWSFASALPVVTLGMVLAWRAYPTRPVLVGALLGLGGGLMADAGWRMFCGYAHPAHVLSAHLGGVVAAAALGALCGRLRRP